MLKRRDGDILAYFDHPHTTGGPTEAINGPFEHLRGSALGFRNITNYITRALLENRRIQTPTTPPIMKSRFSSPITFSPPASSRWRAEYLRNAHPYRFRQCSLIFETRTSRHLSWCEDKLLKSTKASKVNLGDHDTSSPRPRARGSTWSSFAAMRSCSSTGGTGTGSDSALVELSPSFVPPFWRCIICRNPKSEVITV